LFVFDFDFDFVFVLFRLSLSLSCPSLPGPTSGLYLSPIDSFPPAQSIASSPFLPGHFDKKGFKLLSFDPSGPGLFNPGFKIQTRHFLIPLSLFASLRRHFFLDTLTKTLHIALIREASPRAF
jgi:hypothetical protein